jgi:uncharacterized protein (TIGR02246 family)
MQTSMLAKAALAACLSMAACAASAQVDIQQLADQWVSAYNRHDREQLAQLYTTDAKLMVHGSPTVTGRAAIEEFWADDFLEGDPLTLLTVTNSVTGTDMMLVHGNYRVVDRGDGGLLGEGRFSHVWMLDGRTWRLDRDLWNQPHVAYSETAMATDVQMLADRWTEAYNNHDRDALAGLYASDAILMMHGGPSIGSRRDIGDFWAVDFEEDNPLTLLTVTHAVDGVDMVLVHGNYEVIRRSDGMLVGGGRYAHIWFEEDGEWQLDRDLWLQRGLY